VRFLAAGIDVSTKAVSIVVLDVDGQVVVAAEFAIPKQKNKAERCRVVIDTGYSFALVGVSVVYIEQPMGTSIKGVAEVERVVGAVISGIPPRTPVSLLNPGEWKKRNHINGNATKEVIAELVHELYPELAEKSQDIKDAALIARAAVTDCLALDGASLPLSMIQNRHYIGK
jgi:Holliday junction resolvasome RuvABC endonuclease subunit